MMRKLMLSAAHVAAIWSMSRVLVLIVATHGEVHWQLPPLDYRGPQRFFTGEQKS